MLAVQLLANSHVGGRKTRNEDAVLALPRQGLFAVADGVGGVAGGHFASQDALKGLARQAQALAMGSVTLEHCVQELNYELWAQGSSSGTYFCCTLTVCLLREDSAQVAHIGDSRLYQLAPSMCRQITELHHSQRPATAGASSQRSPKLSKCLGMREAFDGQILSIPIESDSYLALVTDGLLDCISERHFHALLVNADSLQDIDAELTECALKASDNVSYIIIRC